MSGNHYCNSISQLAAGVRLLTAPIYVSTIGSWDLHLCHINPDLCSIAKQFMASISLDDRCKNTHSLSGSIACHLQAQSFHGFCLSLPICLRSIITSLVYRASYETLQHTGWLNRLSIVVRLALPTQAFPL